MLDSGYSKVLKYYLNVDELEGAGYSEGDRRQNTGDRVGNQGNRLSGSGYQEKRVSGSRIIYDFRF